MTSPALRLEHIFRQNHEWAEAMLREDPRFFEKLLGQQAPDYLWIGCSDSRVPANEIVGLLPGELFVHRNVANVVSEGDLNGMSALQFAVDVLQVEHVIVTGHYACGGVTAAIRDDSLGLVDEWLRHVRDVRRKHEDALAVLEDETHKIDMLCELNVIEQTLRVTETSIVVKAWERGQSLTIHGWIYGIHDGRLRDLGLTVSGPPARPAYEKAVRTCLSRRGSPI